jgi:hypothetical protein
MPENPGIRIALAQGDRVNMRQLTGIAVACVTLGVLVSGAATRFNAGERGADRFAAEPATEESWSPAIGLPAEPLAIAGQGAKDAGSRPDKADKKAELAGSKADAKSAKHSPVSGSRKRSRFERGAVSYARCENPEQHKRGANCPRDPKLEAAVWSALQSALACYSGKPGSGQAELRLTLHRARPLGIEWQAPVQGRSLNLRAVSQCAGERLSKLRTHLQTDRTLVTFRFGLS